MHKDDRDDADDIADGLDLSGLDVLIDATPAQLARIFADSGSLSLAQIGVADGGELVNQVYDFSVDYSKERSAELVGKKYVNGKLVDNPNAEWSIDDATRDDLRGIITDAVSGKIELSDVEDAIADAGAFSDDRAALIARTEITRANSYGSLGGYQAAKASGVDVKKAWLADDGACDVCLDNESDGVIDLDDQFSSGDDAPPAHPSCECAIQPVVNDESGDEDDDE